MVGNRELALLHGRNRSAFEALAQSERNRQENEDLEARFTRILSSPAIPLRERVRMAAITGVITEVFVESGAAFRRCPPRGTRKARARGHRRSRPHRDRRPRLAREPHRAAHTRRPHPNLGGVVSERASSRSRAGGLAGQDRPPQANLRNTPIDDVLEDRDAGRMRGMRSASRSGRSSPIVASNMLGAPRTGPGTPHPRSGARPLSVADRAASERPPSRAGKGVKGNAGRRFRERPASC